MKPNKTYGVATEHIPWPIELELCFLAMTVFYVHKSQIKCNFYLSKLYLSHYTDIVSSGQHNHGAERDIRGRRRWWEWEESDNWNINPSDCSSSSALQNIALPLTAILSHSMLTLETTIKFINDNYNYN